MRAGGLRQQFALPVVYFEMVLYEAIWDIKAMWQELKNKISSLANQNEEFSDDDKSYIRLVMIINTELNKMFETEISSKIVITAPIKYCNMSRFTDQTKKMFTRSFAGVIREQLKDKCILHGIDLVEINLKDTGDICSC